MPLKKRVTIITAQIVVFISILIIAGKSMAVEEAKYKVIAQEDNLELREYEPHIIAEVVSSDNFEKAGSQAFRPLFNYISGENTATQKIAMTAPVTQSQSQKIAMTTPVTQQKQNGKWLVSFMMPPSFILETTPQPKNPVVKIKQVPKRLVASVRYSGVWNNKSYQTHLNTLNQWIKDKQYQDIGEPMWARYNSPYSLWFMRRNEILIPVKKVSGDDQ